MHDRWVGYERSSTAVVCRECLHSRIEYSDLGSLSAIEAFRGRDRSVALGTPTPAFPLFDCQRYKIRESDPEQLLFRRPLPRAPNVFVTENSVEFAEEVYWSVEHRTDAQFV